MSISLDADVAAARRLVAPGRLVSMRLAGSRGQGRHTPESDFDYQGVYVASPREVLGLTRVEDSYRLQEGDTDITVWEIRHFILCALDGKPNAIEYLLWPTVPYVVSSLMWGQVLDQMDVFLAKDPIHARFGSFGRGVLRDLVDGRKAVKPKRVLHAVRTLEVGKHVLAGNVDQPNTDAGFYDLLMAAPEAWPSALEVRLGELDDALAVSRLPSVPDRAAAEDLLLRIRSADLTSVVDDAMVLV